MDNTMSEKKTESFFDKTVFGGYDPEQVDEFIENCVKPVIEANGVSDDVAEINV